jgi:nitrite reductase (NADH) small subunit/3-phenylpropionate/trans-cinnamate dioxygenase ferredoxin subunit
MEPSAVFYSVARVGEIPEGEGRAFAINGKVVAVFNDRGAYRAIDDQCPHAGASLAAGSLVEGTVVCAWHGWRFHLADGSWADYRKVRIGTYAVQVIGEEIQVEVPDADASAGREPTQSTE